MNQEKEFSKEKDNLQSINNHLALANDKVEIFHTLEKENTEKRVSYFQLQYKFANKIDYILIIIATLGSLIAGASMPLISLLLGSTINNFGPDADKSALSQKVTTLAINYILCGIGILLGSFMMSFFWSLVAKRLINKINVEYFQVLLRQEQGYFDQGQKNEHFVTKINQEIKIIENGIGVKVGQALMSISQFIASFIVGYITSWQLSLVLTAMLPLLGIGGWFMAKAMDQGQASNEAYVNAGAMSQEILKEIKTVASFANFDYEKEKYRRYIEGAMKAGIKQGFKAGFGIGFIVFIVYNSYALAVGYGSYLIANKSTNKNSGEAFGAGDVITVLFSIIFGCFSLGQATPYINAIICACNAAKSLFALLARKPRIDLTTSKLKPEKSDITGRIVFKNVCFAYPSKPDDLILDDLNLVIEPGQKVAIVGESGSGKSTVLSLIERLYDPISGEIFFDNYNIKNLDLEYLRNLIGYVPQMPVLLNTSIKENIIFGRKGVLEEDIDIAINNAYAKEFVDQKGLDYNVGVGGKMLSGGQKQRIAIARSIVNKPKILIFDEATSALDNKAEKEVQNTLDQVCRGLSSITVAHRITTIKNADKIICLDAGKVIEQGTHKELLEKNGFYSHLINQYRDEESEEEEESGYDDVKCEKNFFKMQDGDDIMEYDEEKVEINNFKDNHGFSNNNNIEGLYQSENAKKQSFNNESCNLRYDIDINNKKLNLNDRINNNFNNYNSENLNVKKSNKPLEVNLPITKLDFEEDKTEHKNSKSMKNSKNKFGIENYVGSTTNLKDSYYMNQSDSRDHHINEHQICFNEICKKKDNSSESVNHLQTEHNYDEKNHKADEDDCYVPNSVNESGIEIKDYHRKYLNKELSHLSKNESLLGNSKEKTTRSKGNLFNGHLHNLQPDQALENFSSQKDGYLQIDVEKLDEIKYHTQNLKKVFDESPKNNNLFYNTNPITNNCNINLQHFVSGNLSRDSKKHSMTERMNLNLINSARNIELAYRKSQENVKEGSFRRSINSRNRKSFMDKNYQENQLALAEKNPIKKVEEEEVKYSDEKFKQSRRRLFGILKDHKKFLVGAGIAAAFNGAVWPIYGILLADAIGTLSEKNVQTVRTGGMLVAIFFVCLALAAALVLWMQK